MKWNKPMFSHGLWCHSEEGQWGSDGLGTVDILVVPPSCEWNSFLHVIWLYFLFLNIYNPLIHPVWEILCEFPTPKADEGSRCRCPGRGPYSVLKRIGEVVYWVQLPPRGRKVGVHRDRLAPYRGSAAAALAPDSSKAMLTLEGEAGPQLSTSSPLAVPPAATPVLELQPLRLDSPVTVTL